jgi:L-2,4-diaminobutyrate decarboxylase
MAHGESPVELAAAVPDLDFQATHSTLALGMRLLALGSQSHDARSAELAARISEIGLGTVGALEQAAALVIGQARRLDAPVAFAHMDPPAPVIAWVGALWNAAVNQNLLHAELSPAARLIEEHVVGWLAPWFGMDGGHFTSGSTLANLTALWAARESGVTEVVASEEAHVSVAKAAHVLGLTYRPLAATRAGALDPQALPNDLSRAALVLTAGATSIGAIDPLELAGRSAWTHVDAAWAGPLRLSERHRSLLKGVQAADSIAISAHKLMFQPKGTALVMFRNTRAANRALTSGAGYLASPNVGLQGSRPAAAVPLYLSLLAWGREGLAALIDRCMAAAQAYADWIDAHPRLELFGRPTTGVVLWRAKHETPDDLYRRLPAGLASMTTLAGERWIRNVSANPLVDVKAVIAGVSRTVR